jgi:hypothetical protein
VEVALNFPQECGDVLELFGMVYGNDALAREKVSMPTSDCGFINNTAGTDGSVA